MSHVHIPCQRSNPDLWFAESPARTEQARRLCSRCPVRAPCLDGAKARREPWGVWGGQIFSDGVIVATKRGRGRPRKSERRDETAA